MVVPEGVDVSHEPSIPAGVWCFGLRVSGFAVTSPSSLEMHLAAPGCPQFPPAFASQQLCPGYVRCVTNAGMDRVNLNTVSHPSRPLKMFAELAGQLASPEHLHKSVHVALDP